MKELIQIIIKILIMQQRPGTKRVMIMIKLDQILMEKILLEQKVCAMRYFMSVSPVELPPWITEVLSVCLLFVVCGVLLGENPL